MMNEIEGAEVTVIVVPFTYTDDVVHYKLLKTGKADLVPTLDYLSFTTYKQLSYDTQRLTERVKLNVGRFMGLWTGNMVVNHLYASNIAVVTIHVTDDSKELPKVETVELQDIPQRTSECFTQVLTTIVAPKVEEFVRLHQKEEEQ